MSSHATPGTRHLLAQITATDLCGAEDGSVRPRSVFFKRGRSRSPECSVGPSLVDALREACGASNRLKQIPEGRREEKGDFFSSLNK